MGSSYYTEKYKEDLEYFTPGRKIYYIDRNHDIYRVGSTKIKTYVHQNPDEHSPWDVGIIIKFNNGCESHLPYMALKRRSLLLKKSKGKIKYFDAYFDREDAIKWFENFSRHLISHYKTKFGKWLVKLSIKLSKKCI